MQSSPESIEEKIVSAFGAALDAVDPASLVAQNIFQSGSVLTIGDAALDWTVADTILVLGAGKASGSMAEGFESAIASCKDSDKLFKKIQGTISVVDGTTTNLKSIRAVQTRAPGENAVTERVLKATSLMLEQLKALNANDIVVDLLSGGGSALRELLNPSLSIEEFMKAQRLLQDGGIERLNTVRKFCSEVKGGKLRYYNSNVQVAVLVLSDVVGDSLETIASGPWTKPSQTVDDALNILQSVEGETQSPEVWRCLKEQQRESEQAKLSQAPATLTQTIIGSNSIALEAMRTALEDEGLEVVTHGSEFSESVTEMLSTMLRVIEGQSIRPNQKPIAHIFGGETYVELDLEKASGQGGGRNQRLVLMALEQLKTAKTQVSFFSLGTDGEDGRGPTPVAGAIGDRRVLERAENLGVEIPKYLNTFDEYTFFEQCGGHVTTGLSGTNVCDLMGFVIY